MARILKDFKCVEHGYFEGYYPQCPKGCVDDIMRVYLKAPAYKSDRTKKADRTLNNLATDFQMTDIKSAREGEAQNGYYTRNNAKTSKDIPAIQQPRPGDDAIWGNSRPGDAAIWGDGFKNLNMQSIMKGNMFKPVKDEAVSVAPNTVGNLTGPKVASYLKDHENLSIKE